VSVALKAGRLKEHPAPLAYMTRALMSANWEPLCITESQTVSAAGHFFALTRPAIEYAGGRLGRKFRDSRGREGIG